MSDDTRPGLSSAEIVEQLYDIALDPGSLDRFIEVWMDAGFEDQDVRRQLERINSFDESFAAHLARAETFLSRNIADDEPVALGAALRSALEPFETSAAMVLDENLTIVTCNAGAREQLNVSEGGTLAALALTQDMLVQFQGSLRQLLEGATRPDKLLSLEMGAAQRPVLIHIRRLHRRDADGGPMLLVVTTLFHWQPALGETLEEAFGLTGAEQGVVRALIEGADTKAIATARGTSEGTVRSQIKSILSKMNAHSQTEVIRLVMSLRDVIATPTEDRARLPRAPVAVSANWLEAEVWKPFKTVVLPDGRLMDYHDQGPVDGTPVLYSHMGYVQARWTADMLRLAYKHNLRIICPIRAGYGQSDDLAPDADVIEAIRGDTVFLLDHLGIARLPYVPQGNDFIWAVDLANHHPDRVSEIIGIGMRPFLEGSAHYRGMSKWHSFFLSTAQYAPHLLYFTVKAAIAMARRVGVEKMLRKLNGSSPADVALLARPEMYEVLFANSQLMTGKDTDITQIFVMEVLVTENDWSHMIDQCRHIPVRSYNGAEDPSVNVSTLELYRQRYPWIEFNVLPDGGQMLIYQKYEMLIPIFAQAAQRAALN
ncbi:LuxR C-terminal-related transcriptional regulator [Sulfitobacter sp. F26169L]|uniref:LuxR C-terminal-related transcriptional regulator n=1 Tax=Sulfitobacter sp. F26169L TaxID=2996015 RepID=UPI002260D2F2|nr:LuxR C-terminal-related transcriptional regulator [Sulfitobacter sp. F26169L]MCX7566650.1 LuxR C-terminal-related transcriptional regulator [Sulfitobacter sp. F26169L]